MDEIILKSGQIASHIMEAFLDMLKLIGPFVTAAILFLIIRLIYRYYKYGYREFSFLKKRHSINYKQEMIFFMLEKINGYRKIITLKNMNSHLAIIDETGIYLIYIFNHDGVISGEYSDTYYMKRSNNHELIAIDNPYTLIDDDEKKIKNKLGELILYKYIVINNSCIFTMKYNGPTQRVSFKDFFYKMESSFKNNPKIFSKTEINEYYKTLHNRVN